jgi:hypothetical protein
MLRKVFNGFVFFCAVAGVIVSVAYLLTGAEAIGQPRAPVSAKDFEEVVLFLCIPLFTICGRVLKWW